MPRLLGEFLTYIRTIRGKSERTKKEYSYDLVLLFKFLKCYRKEMDSSYIDNTDTSDIKIDFIREITLEELYAFLEYCETVRNNSAYSRARKVASIKSLFKYIHRKRRLIEYNPAEELETPKIGQRNPIYLTKQESIDFMSGVKVDGHYHRNKCIMTVFLHCALRISELCNMDLASINGDILTVIGKGNKERIIYLNKACQITVEDYINRERCNVKKVKDTGALFLSQKGNRISTREVQRIVKQINTNSIKKEKLTPHKLRHTSATLLYSVKKDILSLKYVLGHQNVSTTQVYTHIDDQQIRSFMCENPLNE